MGMLLPNQNRAKTALAMIWIVGALNAISFASDFFQYQLLQKANAGGIITPESASANDMRQQIIAIAYTLTFIISSVTFILWFRRAYNNLHQRNSFLSFSEGWAAGAWFVPILNLFRPYQIMRELYVETKKILADHEIIYMQKLPVKLLGIWWAFWICNGVSSQVVLRLSRSAETISAIQVSTVASMIDNIIGVTLALVTVKVIKNYADVEPLLMDISEQPESVAEKVDLL